MNKKGFTLVELLAVIIILALLALLASTAVTKLVKDSKDDLYNNQLLLIEKAAEAWGADNINLLPDVGSCKYLTLLDLQEYGLLDSNITNPRTNEPFKTINIKISAESGKHGNEIIEYAVNPESIDGCSRIYYSDGAEVYFDVASGESCTEDDYVVQNSTIGYNGITPLVDTDGDGIDDYGRNSCLKFYSFSSYIGNRVNLLLDHNTTSTIAWSSIPDSSSGPSDESGYILDKLKLDTNSWSNKILPPTTYTDKTGYIINYEEGEYKARLITIQELVKIVGSDEICSSCLELDSNYEWIIDQTINLKIDSKGYWTASTSTYYADVMVVTYKAQSTPSITSSGHIFTASGYYGIRPVIEVNKSSLE